MRQWLTLQDTTDHHTIMVESSNVPKTLVDPLRIEQVVTNLLTNAIKFSPDGGQIKVELSQRDSNILISITDQGIGIPPEKLPFIFERFYQVDQHSNLGGMGLGLYISRQIIELHHGTIGAELVEQGGTRFTVTLPLQR
jgi:signal transduction histidine kinase